MFGWLKKSSIDKDAARRWRDAVTAEARLPEPFLKGWVPDTIYGRFNMVTLVATFAMRRLRDCGADGRALSKAFGDLLFSDFDHALRENGVGDARRFGSSRSRYDLICTFAELPCNQRHALPFGAVAHRLRRLERRCGVSVRWPA